jgi:hypothetical protein
MALHLGNISRDTVNVCLAFADPNCTANNWPWRKVAWYVIGPFQTMIPDVFAVDLTTVNGIIALYAIAGSLDKDWQGTGNNWYNVPNGVPAFNQCLGDNTNCPKQVDFEVISFGGNSNLITLLGPEAPQIQTLVPSIAVTPGTGAFFISGRGFAPGSTVNVVYNYFPSSGGVTTNSGAPATPSVDSSGGFTDIVSVSTLLEPGHLDVRATDNNFPGLSAVVSVSVT